MQSGSWAERWERRRLRHLADEEALDRRKPLPSWIATALSVAFWVFLVVVAWSEAGPVLGLATAVVLTAESVAKVFRWNWWEERSLSGGAEPIAVLRRSVMLTSCLCQMALGLTLMVVSSGPAGVLVGLGLGLTALLGMVVVVFRPAK